MVAASRSSAIEHRETSSRLLWTSTGSFVSFEIHWQEFHKVRQHSYQTGSGDPSRTTWMSAISEPYRRACEMEASKQDRTSPRPAVPIMELLPKNGLVYSEKANFSEVLH